MEGREQEEVVEEVVEIAEKVKGRGREWRLLSDHVGCNRDVFYAHGGSERRWQKAEGYDGIESKMVNECPTCGRKAVIRIPQWVVMQMRLEGW